MFGTRKQDVENVTQERKQPEKEKIVAERVNGQAAILGCIALIGAYATTGQIIPGIFYWIENTSTGSMLRRSMVVSQCSV